MRQITRICFMVFATSVFSRNLIGVAGDRESAGHRNWALLPDYHFCGIDTRPNTHLFGDISSKGQFPWTAILIYDTGLPASPPRSEDADFLMINLGDETSRDIRGNDGVFCTGVLISLRYVLTVAHCVTGPLKRRLYGVRLGQNFISGCPNGVCREPVQEIAIRKVTPHENFSKTTGANNLALLRLEHAAALNKYVNPICFPRTISPEANLDYDVVALTGIQRVNLRVETKTIKFLPIYSDAVVIAAAGSCRYERSIALSKNQVCVRNMGGRKTCPFYSGAPIMAKEYLDRRRSKYILLGLDASMSCGYFQDSAYTTVTYFIKWVLDHLEE